MKNILLGVLATFINTQILYAADGTVEPEDQVDDCWDTESYLRLGKTIFESNCMVCHRANGQALGGQIKFTKPGYNVMV